MSGDTVQPHPEVPGGVGPSPALGDLEEQRDRVCPQDTQMYGEQGGSSGLPIVSCLQSAPGMASLPPTGTSQDGNLPAVSSEKALLSTFVSAVL